MTTQIAPRPHGAFTWMDLATPDLEGAKRFYHRVFGWEFLDLGAEVMHYHYALAQGRPVADLGQLQPGSAMPTAWTIFLASAEGDAERVKALGGQVLLEPMRIGDAGKMSICVDPTGCIFGLWQPIDFIGAAVEGEPGGIAWSEANTRDAAAACDFYGKLFDLTPSPQGEAYFIMRREEEMLFGVQQMNAEWGDFPPHWMGYLAVDDVGATVEHVAAGGGSILVPAFDTPYGRIAVIGDPYGAICSVIQLPTAA